MKKALHVIAAMFIATAAMSQAVPNGNFEHWDSVINQNPDMYQCSNAGRGNLPTNAPANVTQATGYHGKYGVQLTTTVFDGDTGFAYITNSINNPLAGQGGIPYAQEPIGVRVYYKCNIVSGDSATILFVFKKAGTIIGTYGKYFTGTTSSYTLLSLPFLPALTQTPDSVIFAAVSSDILSGGSGKAGSTLTIDSITFTGVSSQPTMMNGDFENWTPDSVYSPVSWFIENGTNAVTRTTQAISGKYALELTTGLPPGNTNIQEGFATDGQLVQVSSNSDSIVGGYPYSQQSDSVICYYKYTPGGIGDTGNIFFQFNKNSHVIGGFGMPATASATWVRASGYFNLASTPDSVLTFVSSSSNNPQIGSQLIVDSIRFYSEVVTGVQAINNNGSVKVYPNPSSNMVYVDFTNLQSKVDMISIYDMSGKLIESRNYFFTPLKGSVESFDISNYSAGTYFISVKTASGIKTEKITKE